MTASLPEPVRARVVALAAGALAAIGSQQLPAPLRKVADFSPARRARLGGPQITAALEQDDAFRDRVAVQVRAALPELAEALEGDGSSPATDPVDTAALAWLLRPEGWTLMLADATRLVDERQHAVAEERDGVEVERLRRRLEDADRQARGARARHKEQTEALKADNVTLRRKLGEARAHVRAGLESAETTTRAAEADRAAAVVAASAVEAEVRRLRQQVEELQTSVASTRRTVREGRDDTALRARLLLDTLLDSAQGLRRELALPTTSGTPADRVETELAERGTRTTTAAGALGPASAALLEQYLSLPRARLIVDGYNVTKSVWPEVSLELQRNRLLTGLAALVARSGAETTVVFDAAASTTRPPVRAPRGVRVLFSPVGVIADDVIRELVAAEPPGRVVVVVSSDQEVARDVTAAGARTVGSGALVPLLGTG